MKRDFPRVKNLSLSDIRVILLANCFIFVYNVQVTRNIVYTFDMMVKAFLPWKPISDYDGSIYEYCGLRCFFVLGDRKEGIMLEKLFKLNVKQTSENRGNCRYHNLSGNGLYSWVNPSIAWCRYGSCICFYKLRLFLQALPPSLWDWWQIIRLFWLPVWGLMHYLLIRSADRWGWAGRQHWLAYLFPVWFSS